MRRPPKQTEPPFPPRLLYIPLGLLFALVAAASFLPDRRLWGINHLAFYSLPFRLGALLIIGVSFAPAIARGLHGAMSKAVRGLGAERKGSVWVALTISLASVAVFVHLQSSTLLLGDGRLVADNFKHAFMGDQEIITSSPHKIMEKEHIAKGATILYYGFTHAAHRIFKSPPLKAMRILNCLLGGIFVFVLMHLVQRSKLSIDLRMWLILLVVSSGAIELFFGYVENYTTLLLFAVLYLISSVILIHRKHSIWLLMAFIWLVTGIFMHIQASLLAPSFAFLLIWHIAARRRKSMLRLTTVSLIGLILIGAYVSGAFTRYGEYLLPLKATGETTSVLTASHWLDVLNELLILVPALPLLAVMAVIVLRERRYTGQPGESPIGGRTRKSEPHSQAHASGQLSAEAECHFALLVLVPCVVFLIVFNPKLGMARDWDLFALTSVGLIPLALLVLRRFVSVVRTPAVTTIIMPALVMSTVLTVSWIGVNSSSERSTARYEHILKYDKTFAPYAYETLAKHYYDKQCLKEAIAAMEEAVSLAYNSRLYILLSIYYRESGRLLDAAGLLREVLDKQPYFEKVRAEMALLLYRAGQYDEVLEVAGKGTEYYPQNPLFHALYGRALIQEGRIEEGIDELLELKHLNPPTEMMEDVERILKQLKDEGKL